ncbi:MAG: diguanylate cyclase [Treponema sp.]|nr:diguanylate cyclase [Treponema sp.]
MKDEKRPVKNSNLFILVLFGGLAVLLLMVFTTLWVVKSAGTGTSQAVEKVNEFYVQELANRRVVFVTDEIKRNYAYIQNALSIITPQDLSSKRLLREYLNKIRKLYRIDNFSLVDENGIIYDYRSSVTGLSRYPFLKERISEPVLHMENIYGAKKEVILAMPVYNIQFQGAKIIACFVKIQFEKLLSSLTHSSELMRTYFNIYYKDGESLTNTYFGPFGVGRNIIHALDEEAVNLEACEQIKYDFEKRKRGGVNIEYHGGKALLYYVPVERTNWMLAVLVYDNVISKQINTITEKILERNRIQISIMILSVLILAMAIIKMVRRNAKLMLDQEKIITEKMQVANERLNEEMQAMKIIHGVLNSGSWSMEFDNDANITQCHWSRDFRKMIGFGSSEEFPNVLGSWSNRLHPDDKDRVIKAFWAAAKDYSGQTIYDVEYRLMTKLGDYKWYHSAGDLLRRSDGSPISYIGLFTDIDESKRNELALKEQFLIVEGLSRDYKNVFKIDPADETATVIKLTGYVTKGLHRDAKTTMPYDILANQYIGDRVYAEDVDFMRKAMSLEAVVENLKNSEEYTSTYRVIDNNEIHYYQFTYMLLEDKTIVAGFKNVDDVVHAAKERETLIALSETDLMTGLLNRGSGERKINEALMQGSGGLFILLDIDKFKYFNDNFGHEIGDKVIIEVAKSVRAAFRDNDIVFRLGGDEFSAYAQNVFTQEDAYKILDRFAENLKKIIIPELNGHPIYASVGATIIKKDEPADFTGKYKLVDAGVYESKKIQGTSITFKFD